jgi:hypothetical protein
LQPKSRPKHSYKNYPNNPFNSFSIARNPAAESPLFVNAAVVPEFAKKNEFLFPENPEEKHKALPI